MYELKRGISSVDSSSSFADMLKTVAEYVDDAEKQHGAKCRIENGEILIDHDCYTEGFTIEEY